MTYTHVIDAIRVLDHKLHGSHALRFETDAWTKVKEYLKSLEKRVEDKQELWTEGKSYVQRVEQ